MKISLAQINPIVGNIQYNVEKIKSCILTSEASGVDLVIFPELIISAYPPLDMLNYKTFVKSCEDIIEKEIVPLTKNMAVILGSPKSNQTIGKENFNAAYFIENGEIKNVYHKINLPDYDVFDEGRYFEKGKEKCVISIKGEKWLLTICEDLWGANGLYENDIYQDKVTYEGIDGIINIAASPYNHFQKNIRKNHLSQIAKNNALPLVYVNNIGTQTDLIFDGGSKVFNKEGEVILQSAFFEEDLQYFDSQEQNHSTIKTSEEKLEKLHDALVLGIKDFFQKQGFKKAVLGFSGGIDSALTLYLAVKALGAENVLAVLLPSQFSSEHSISDSIDLVKNLDCQHETIAIKDIYESFNQALSPLFKNLPFNITEENLQARSRGVLLMAISNKLGYILLNTTNKSEMAVGYGTLYGDMCGSLSVLGDVYKMEVFELCKWINRKEEIIPNNIIIKPPSAELRPDQKDSDSLPEYDVLDKILFEFIENQKTAKEIIAQGFESETVQKIIRLVNANEYKRFQAAPVLRVSTKAFGVGRKMPLVGNLSNLGI